ncbi:hypothetical protein [Pseudoalteromonas sp. OOF1S-7]|uniref:hypothetical protein n=1 Tax=Pseudoalteromonas sp. OOF1S-7 TaxID=2917757 RepID=UPI001EF642C8|nr:hypothetical protein [Pseudoalteromonas sp. OOF1S-7]MCG7537508.1 hypothetical protein [Pseudoalteromonas sp. OOF1S-7]
MKLIWFVLYLFSVASFAVEEGGHRKYLHVYTSCGETDFSVRFDIVNVSGHEFNISSEQLGVVGNSGIAFNLNTYNEEGVAIADIDLTERSGYVANAASKEINISPYGGFQFEVDFIKRFNISEKKSYRLHYAPLILHKNPDLEFFMSANYINIGKGGCSSM